MSSVSIYLVEAVSVDIILVCCAIKKKMLKKRVFRVIEDRTLNDATIEL